MICIIRKFFLFFIAPASLGLTIGCGVDIALSSNSATDDMVDSAEYAEDGSTEMVTIDVMVVYTKAAQDGAGGPAALESLIILAESLTNQGYENSDIYQRIRIVHTQLVDYDESAGGHTQALYAISDKNDGIIDFIHVTRNKVKADVVSFWIKHRVTLCGLAYKMTNISRSFDKYAFNVVDYSCAVSGYVFAHELGHNQGADHDVAHSEGATLTPYSFGFQQTSSSPRFYTIMSAPCAGCKKINNFSNPDVSFSGWESGALGVADNASTINSSRLIAANWR